MACRRTHEGITPTGWRPTQRRRDRRPHDAAGDADETLARAAATCSPRSTWSRRPSTGSASSCWASRYVGVARTATTPAQTRRAATGAGAAVRRAGHGSTALRARRRLRPHCSTSRRTVSCGRHPDLLDTADAGGSIGCDPRSSTVRAGCSGWSTPLTRPDADPAAAARGVRRPGAPGRRVNPVAGLPAAGPHRRGLRGVRPCRDPLGQIMPRPADADTVTWEPAPGRPLPPDAGPLAALDAQTQHVGVMAAGMVQADVRHATARRAHRRRAP